MANGGLLIVAAAVGVLLLVASVESRAEYPSFAACNRAGEPLETCERLFPQPKAPPPKPKPLEACTGMLFEATEQAKQAIIYFRFDSRDEGEMRVDQASSLLSSAVACFKTVTRATPAAQAAWAQQMSDYEAQLSILEAVIDAKKR